MTSVLVQEALAIALTVRLNPELSLQLKRHGVSFRPRKTNQAMIVEAIKAYLAQAKESPRWLSNTWCCKRRRRLVHLPT
jgi:hypothetical protein